MENEINLKKFNKIIFFYLKKSIDNLKQQQKLFKSKKKYIYIYFEILNKTKQKKLKLYIVILLFIGFITYFILF